MRITIDQEIKEFSVPSFVIPVSKPGNRQEGFKDPEGIPLRDLDQMVLDKLCIAFRRAVFQKAEKQDPMDLK